MEDCITSTSMQRRDDENAGTISSSVGNHIALEEEEEDLHYEGHRKNLYGWFSCRPSCLQWLNNPKGYLLCLCFFLFGQGMAVNGLVYLVITNLERRFNLTSVQSAFISSIYDFCFMFIVIFVTYFGERAHKPRILGIGAFIFAFGSVVFTLPHFLTGPYNFEGAEFDTCQYNRTEPDICSDDDNNEDLRKYYAVFIIAQGLHALGASAIFTLGLTYIDDNSPQGTAAIHTGKILVCIILKDFETWYQKRMNSP